MTQTIARLYGNRDQADTVVRTLRVRGYTAEDIHIVTGDHAPVATLEGADPQEGTAEAPSDMLLDAVLRAGVDPDHAPACADRIRNGETLVAVAAAFGFARTTISVMHRAGPAVELPVIHTPSDEPVPRYAAAPLSAAMGWRVLSDDPTPLSTWLNWPTLKPEPAESATLDKIRRQSKDPAPLSRKIGMKVLSDDATPLSDKFGWRVLSDDPAPLSRKIGWRTLIDRPAPLSEKVGMPTLSDDPAPLSRKTGWRLLLNDPAPLSRLLGLKVLSTD